MTLQGTRQPPLAVQMARKSDLRTQFAALCFRIRNGKSEILLITSRGTGKWIIPKGWPMAGLTPSEGAAQEAWEEAGVKGKTFDRSLGLFSYIKQTDKGEILPVVAMVFPIKVKSLAKDFPEAGQRKRKWVSPKKAAAMVADRELAHILRTFDAHLV